MCLTRSGRVWACGTAENGHLGNGTTGERIVTAGKVTFDTEASWVLVAFPGPVQPTIADVQCGE